MGLQWVRLDTAFPRNPKILALLEQRNGRAAAFAYVCALAYAGEQGTDGWIPREALPLIHAKPADASALVEHGLWVEQPGGWRVHGWDEFQESSGESQERRKRAQAAAQARWDGYERQSAAERTRRWRERHAERDQPP